MKNNTGNVSKTSKILFCRLRSTGDIIRTFPIIHGFKEKYPQVKVGYICYREHKSLLECNPDIDYIHAINPSKSNNNKTNFKYWQETINLIKSLDYSLFFDFHGIYYSSIIGEFAAIPIRIGYSSKYVKNGSEIRYTNKIDLPAEFENRYLRHQHLINSYFNNITSSPLKIPTNHNFIDNYFLICPGSSIVGKLKRWPINNYILLAHEILNRYNTKVVVAFGPDEIDLVKYFKDDEKTLIIKQVSNIEDVFMLTGKSCCTIGNDGAWLHAASIQGAPCIMLIGPSSVRKNHPSNLSMHATISINASCSPCELWDFECPHNHICMRQITISDVMTTIANILHDI